VEVNKLTKQSSTTQLSRKELNFRS